GTARPRRRRARHEGARADRSALPDAHPEVDGTAGSARQDAHGPPRPGAGQDGSPTETPRVARRLSQRESDMSTKAEKVGVVVSDGMQKSCVVAVEWQVRHGLYGKTERRTSKFMVHDEKNEAKTGDMVAIVETRPMSRRKRWALTRVVRTAV